ncbi:MAG: CYTH domain-containing protein [Elusimicrobiaceae bacterium]|nr:CYTH domain-containing protein [Elusimicrobiaceae bacterium]
MRNLEIECKWDANAPRAFMRAEAFVKEHCKKIVQRNLSICDIYLDHPTHDLAKQHIALRVRNTNGIWESTFKTQTVLKHGKAVRHEETLPLPRAKTKTQALHQLAQQTKWREIGTTNLCVQFVLRNKRRTYTFDYRGATLEMALDQITIYVSGRRVHMREIEVELKYGTSKKLEQFARLFTAQTQIAVAKISKVKTAQALLKLWKE